jgi:membrane-associated phospholipid phosphatase
VGFRISSYTKVLCKDRGVKYHLGPLAVILILWLSASDNELNFLSECSRLWAMSDISGRPVSANPPRSSRALILWVALLPLVILAIAAGVAEIDLPILRVLTEMPSQVKRSFRYAGYTGDATAPIAGSLLLYLVIKFVLPRFSVSTEKYEQLKNFGLTLFCALAYSGVSVQIMKRAFGRQRPYITDMMTTKIFEPMNASWEYHSFPSGHTQVVSCVATVVCLYFPKLRWPIVIWALVVAISRIITGNHYPSDLVGGAYMGIFGGLLMASLFHNHK